MDRMWFKMAYDVVTLTIFFESAQNGFFVLIIVFTSCIDYQHECTFGYNYIYTNIGPE